MKKLLYAVVVLLITSCTSHNSADRKRSIISSISPIDGLVEKISGNDFDYHIMVPLGVSPESYSPTPLQIRQLDDADFIFITGTLDFERELISRFADNSKIMSKIVDLSSNIVPIKSHENNIDPHIWLSINNLHDISQTIYNKLHESFVDSIKYTDNYQRFEAELTTCDSIVKQNISKSELKDFIIYHPALTYFSKDYGLTQIAIENDGKEPSAKYLTELSNYININNIRYILYQKEMTDDIIQPITEALNVQPVMIDPLSNDILSELIHISEIISRQ